LTVTVNLTGLQTTLLLSVLLYAASMAIVKVDSDFNWRWPAFFLHMLALLVVALPYAREKWREDIAPQLDRKDLYLLAPLMVLAVLTSFVVLQEYPLVSVGDELRDGGLQAAQILDGTMKNLFGWGTYEGIGLYVPTFTSFFYPLFGRSMLTFRVPAAIISVLDVFLLYLLVRLALNRSAAFWSSLVLVTVPLHLFVTRTQFSLILNSFFTTLMLLLAYLLLRRRDTITYAALGLVIGFAFNFQVAGRVVGVVVLGLVLLVEGWRLVTERPITRQAASMYLVNAGVLVAFVFVGFGPRLWFTPMEIFLHQRGQGQGGLLQQSPAVLQTQYIKSFLALFYENVTSMDPKLTPAPLLSPLLGAMFLVGFGYAFFVLRNTFVSILLLLCVIIPFTHSAMTNLLNAAHRLTSWLPLIAIFVGLGIVYLLNQLTRVPLRAAGAAIAAVVLLGQVNWFFTAQPLNTTGHITDFLAMHTAYFLSDRATLGTREQPTPYCMHVSPTMQSTMSTAHWGEAFQYFAPRSQVTTSPNSAVKDTELYLYQGGCPPGPPSSQNAETITCSPGKQLVCPRDFEGEFVIHY
jgi:hypothetical protein